MSAEWNGSRVMDDFVKIAAESGLISADLSPESDDKVVGNPHKDNPEWTRHEESEDYGVTDGTGADLINKAHPDRVETADAMGDGGVVENQNEQQKKNVEIATRLPHGTLVGVHASLARELVRLANELDDAGNGKAAARIDRAIRRLGKRPFARAEIDKRGAIFTTIALISALVAGLGAGQHFLNFSGRTESLYDDIKDLIEVAQSAGEDASVSALSLKLVRILSPYQTRFMVVPTPDNKAALATFVKHLQSFGRKLPQIESLVKMMVVAGGGAQLYYLGFDVEGRLKDKMNSVKESYMRLSAAVLDAAQAGKQKLKPSTFTAPAPAKTPSGPGNISRIQKMLGVPVTGKLDDATKRALKGVEMSLELVLADILSRKGWQVSGMILRPNGTVMNAESLKRLMELAGQVKRRKKVS